MSESGTLTNDWLNGPLEKFVKFIDYRGKTPQKIESGMRLITAKNVKMGFIQDEPREFVDPAIYDSWMTRGIPRYGDVLFTTEAPLGNVAQLNTNEKVIFAQRVIIMQPNQKQLDSTFLKFMLLTGFMQKRIHEKGTGATAKGIKSKLLKQIPISFPESLSEQKRIVAILDEAFGAIARAKENAARNLANARELFDSYLSKLDADKKRLGDFVEIRTGKLNANAATSGGQYPFFTCSKEVFNIDHYAFDCDAVLLAGNNASGDFNVKHYNGKFNAYQRTYVITVQDESELLSSFLYFQLTNSLKELKESSVGANTRFLKLGMIQNLKICVPAIKKQQQLLYAIQGIEQGVKSLEEVYQRKLFALDELKQSLLQKAFTGQLTSQSKELELVP